MTTKIQDQEEIYYKKITDLLNDKKLTAKKRNRAETELKIIRKTSSCKKLFILYTAVNKIKDDDQRYRLLGDGSDTLLFYLLGISNIDPYDKKLPYVLPYEPAIGIVTNPRPIDCSLLVQDSYKNELIDYLKLCFEADSDFYPCVDLFSERFQYSKYRIAVIPKEGNPYKYGKYINAYGLSGFLTCFEDPIKTKYIYIQGSNTSISRESSLSKLKDIDYAKVYSCFLESVINGNKDFPSALNREYASLNKKKMNTYRNSFWEFCSDINRQFNSKNVTRSVIRSSEDLWNVINKTKLSKKDKYSFFLKAYKGKELSDTETESIKEVYGKNYSKILKEIKGAKIVWSIIHTINYVMSEIGSFYENNKTLI